MLVESIAIERLPSPVTNDAPRSTSYHVFATTAPKVATGEPEIAGRAAKVIDSPHVLEASGNTRPPSFEASFWNIRSRAPTTFRPAMPVTGKRRNDCFTGSLSAASELELP